MNGKRLILTAAFFSACTLFADVLLEVRPGEVIKDQWQKDRGTFTTGSHPKNVTAGKDQKTGFARYLPDSSTYYKLKDMKNCGTSNFTVTALLRFSGKDGQCFVMGVGAGSHVSPGYRLGISANKGKVFAYAMFVAASTKETAKKFVTVNMDPKMVLEPGKWVVLTLSANRSGDLQLFVNGELAGSKPMKAYDRENLSRSRFSLPPSARKLRKERWNRFGRISRKSWSGMSFSALPRFRRKPKICWTKWNHEVIPASFPSVLCAFLFGSGSRT